MKYILILKLIKIIEEKFNTYCYFYLFIIYFKHSHANNIRYKFLQLYGRWAWQWSNFAHFFDNGTYWPSNTMYRNS